MLNLYHWLLLLESRLWLRLELLLCHYRRSHRILCWLIVAKVSWDPRIINWWPWSGLCLLLLGKSLLLRLVWLSELLNWLLLLELGSWVKSTSSYLSPRDYWLLELLLLASANLLCWNLFSRLGLLLLLHKNTHLDSYLLHLVRELRLYELLLK